MASTSSSRVPQRGQGRRGEDLGDGGVGDAGLGGEASERGPAGAVVEVVEGVDEVAVRAGWAGRGGGARSSGTGCGRGDRLAERDVLAGVGRGPLEQARCDGPLAFAQGDLRRAPPAVRRVVGARRAGPTPLRPSPTVWTVSVPRSRASSAVPGRAAGGPAGIRPGSPRSVREEVREVRRCVQRSRNRSAGARASHARGPLIAAAASSLGREDAQNSERVGRVLPPPGGRALDEVSLWMAVPQVRARRRR